MKHVFIINPIAGKKDQSSTLINQIENVYAGEEYYIELTKYEGHAIELAKQYAMNGDDVCIYACGGDGTLFEVVNGMYAYPNASFAMIPIGTGNDFIKYFKSEYTKEDFQNLLATKNGEVVDCDLLKCNDQVCLNIASVGFDARVVQKVKHYKKWPLVNGTMAYLLSVVHSFFASMKFRYPLRIDGRDVAAKDYIFIVAANGTYYGGGFNPTPDGKINDGLIDMLTIDAVSRIRVLTLIKVYQEGKHLDYDICHHEQCKELQVLGKDIVLNMDGETIVVDDPKIRILPSALKLVLPKK